MIFRSLLRNLLNYALHKEYNNLGDESKINWDEKEETCRRSFCLNLNGVGANNVEMIRRAIYYNKEQIYGGVGFDEKTLVFEGVPGGFQILYPN